MKRRVLRGAVALAVFLNSKEGRELINQLARSREAAFGSAQVEKAAAR